MSGTKPTTLSAHIDGPEWSLCRSTRRRWSLTGSRWTSGAWKRSPPSTSSVRATLAARLKVSVSPRRPGALSSWTWTTTAWTPRRRATRWSPRRDSRCRRPRPPPPVARPLSPLTTSWSQDLLWRQPAASGKDRTNVEDKPQDLDQSRTVLGSPSYPVLTWEGTEPRSRQTPPPLLFSLCPLPCKTWETPGSCRGRGPAGWETKVRVLGLFEQGLVSVLKVSVQTWTQTRALLGKSFCREGPEQWWRTQPLFLSSFPSLRAWES